MVILLIFGKINELSYDKGKSAGLESQEEYLRTFRLIDEGKKIKDSNVLLFKIDKQAKPEVGYILASNGNLLAIYTKDKGLLMLRYDKINAISSYTM
jgi:hypothetical protein